MHILRHSGEVLAFVESYPDPCVSALIQQRMEELTDEDSRVVRRSEPRTTRGFLLWAPD